MSAAPSSPPGSRPRCTVPPSVLDELEWRGLIAQSTDATALAAGTGAAPMTVYAGFDPTARSLHAGNLVPLITLRRLQQAGHRPIVIAGGATGHDRRPERAGLRAGHAHRRGGRGERRAHLQAVAPLSGLHARPGAGAAGQQPGMDRAAVGDRLPARRRQALPDQRDARQGFGTHPAAKAAGITFTEFSYQLLQANDYLELLRRYDCRLQIGGRDQWGNITAGLDLIRG